MQLRVADPELAQRQDLGVRVPRRIGVGIRAVGQDPADQRALLLADGAEGCGGGGGGGGGAAGSLG